MLYAQLLLFAFDARSNLYLAGNLVYVSRRNLSQTFATHCMASSANE